MKEDDFPISVDDYIPHDFWLRFGLAFLYLIISTAERPWPN